MGNRTGPISREEIKFIKENYMTFSPAELAEKIKRTEAAVRQIMINNLKISPDEESPQNRVDEIAYQKELLKSPEWKALKEEFMPEELLFFQHRYGKMVAQFAKDEEILATEETQIFLLLKYEILMQRNLKDAKRSSMDIERMEKMLQDTYDNYADHSEMDDQTKSYVLNLENQLLSHRAAKQSKSAEYEKLTARHSALMKELKGTRDQRLDKIEKSKMTFLDVIKDLQNAEAQGKAGRHMELIAMAKEKEKERLSQLHTYDDGNVDQPLLTPENVI